MRSVQQLRENEQKRFNEADESPETRDPGLLRAYCGATGCLKRLPQACRGVLEMPTSISSHAFWLRSHAFQIGISFWSRRASRGGRGGRVRRPIGLAMATEPLELKDDVPMSAV